MEVDHIDIQVYGPRNQLLGHTRVPAHVVERFTTLVADARQVNPVYDVGLVARWMMKAGYRVVLKTLRQGKVELKPGGE